MVGFVDIIKKTINLNQKEFILIKDFEIRWKIFLEHDKEIKELITQAEGFIRDATEERYRTIQYLVTSLKDKIHSSLRYISEEDTKGREVKGIFIEEQASEEEGWKVLETDLLGIRANLNILPAGEVKSAIIKFLSELEEEKQTLQREERLNLFFTQLLKDLGELIEKERECLETELGVLDQVYIFDYQTFRDPEKNPQKREEVKTDLAEGNKILSSQVLFLRDILEKERGTVINPYKTFTNQRAAVLKILSERAQERVITKEMVVEDLRKLTPEQAAVYLQSLEQYFPKLQKIGVAFYLRFKRLFLRKRERRHYEREDELLGTVVELQQALNLDPLMGSLGVTNRKFFQGALFTRIQELGKIGGFISIVYLDLDKFKEVNDHYSHHVGDKVLVAVARAIMESIQERDSVSRIGGEEIAIIFGNVQNVDEPKERAERICKTIPERAKLLILGDKEDYGELEHLKEDLRSGKRMLTASIGVATIKIFKRTIDPKALSFIGSLLTRTADKLLYASKSEGRNRVTAEILVYKKDEPQKL